MVGMVRVVEDIEQASCSCSGDFSRQVCRSASSQPPLYFSWSSHERGKARAGLGFHVVPPHVFGAFAVGPDVLAGNRLQVWQPMHLSR